MQGKRLLPARVVADLLGVCLKTLHNWEDREILKPEKRINTRRYYSADAVEALMLGEDANRDENSTNQMDGRLLE